MNTPKISRILSETALLGSLLAAAGWAAGPGLTVGSTSGQAGATVTLSVNFNPSTASVAGIQFNLTLPTALSTGTVTGGAILTSASKSVSTNVSGNTWTFLIFGLNQNTIASGILLTAQLTIAAGTAAGTLNLPISGIVYSDPSGNMVAGGTSTGGSIIVNLPVPVITSSGTASSHEGTAFSYQITATNSPTSFGATGLPAGLSVNTTTGLISGNPTTSGTFSVTLSATNAGGTGSLPLALTVASACDLNNDGAVNAADVQIIVNQAIGVASCTADLDQDSDCDVIEVQRVVNAVLGGQCVVGP